MKSKSGQKKEYFPKLQRLIEEFGEWEVNLHQLNREWNIPVSTLHRWKVKIMEDIGFVDVQKVGRNVELAMVSNLKLAQKLIRSADNTNDKTRALKAYNDIVKTYGEFVEKWGYKEKVADILITDNQLSWKDFNELYEESIKEKETEKDISD